jgi:hypothetical protein
MSTLIRQETMLHRAETRCDATRLSALLHPDFEEFGRSGRAYSRDEVLSEFSEDRDFPEIVSEDFRLTLLAQGVALLTYVSAHKGPSGDLHRRTLRSSVWTLGESGWKLRFHQGTPADEGNGPVPDTGTRE